MTSDPFKELKINITKALQDMVDAERKSQTLNEDVEHMSDYKRAIEVVGDYLKMGVPRVRALELASKNLAVNKYGLTKAYDRLHSKQLKAVGEERSPEERYKKSCDVVDKTTSDKDLAVKKKKDMRKLAYSRHKKDVKESNIGIHDYDQPYKVVRGHTSMARWIKKNIHGDPVGQHKRYGSVFKGKTGPYLYSWVRQSFGNDPTYRIRLHHPYDSDIKRKS